MRGSSRALVLPCFLIALGCTGRAGGAASDDERSSEDERADEDEDGVTTDDDDASDSGGTGGGPAEPRCDDLASRRILKLDDRQYAAAARDLVGQPSLVVRVQTPGASPDVLFEDLASQSVGASLATQLQAVAESAAAEVEKNPAFVGFSCAPNAANDCVSSWLDRFLRRAFRRPATAAERTEYQALYDEGARDGAASGASLVVEAVLQSPAFLYRTELGEDDGDAARVRLTQHELASQLAFWLTGTSPDDVLADLADEGKLDAAELGRQVDRLLGSQRTHDVLDAAVLRWFAVSDVVAIDKDRTRFPTFAAARPSLLQSMQRSIDDVLWKDGGARMTDLYVGNAYYVDKTIASLFGVPAPASGMERVTVPADQRGGILTHPAILAKQATDRDTHVIHRGGFVRRETMCLPLPPPPPELADAAATLGNGLDQRQFAALRAMKPECSSCHALIDPLGLMFERYDAVGAYRATDADGKPIDTAGDVVDVDFEGRVSGPIELGEKLSRSTSAASCVATRMLSLATQTRLPVDACVSTQLAKRLDSGDGRLPTLASEIVRSEAFRFRRP